MTHFPEISLYIGTVMHARMQPKAHRFSYRVFNILIDIRALNSVNNISKIFSVNRWNILSFFEVDHGARGTKPLIEHIVTLAKDAGITTELGQIVLWCYPRLFGYVFNPISVFFIYAKTGELVALNYEVRNTFGGMHSYFLPIQDGQITEAGIRQTAQKAFFVSPFMDMAQTYNFRLSPIGEKLNVRILETQNSDNSPILAAAFSGVRQEFTTQNLLRNLIKIPFHAFKIIIAIHYEALRLYLKGIKLHSAPK